jgi:hypothetical protein
MLAARQKFTSTKMAASLTRLQAAWRLLAREFAADHVAFRPAEPLLYGVFATLPLARAASSRGIRDTLRPRPEKFGPAS